MIRGLWSAASGMSAQQLSIDVIANNLAILLIDTLIPYLMASAPGLLGMRIKIWH
jgi:hypothetical protein